MRPLHNRVLILILSIFLTHTHVHGLPLYSLTLTPESGKLILKPDNTSGWGYRITNNSDHFLIPLSIDADIVFDGILFPLFDFPVIAPHSFWNSLTYMAKQVYLNSRGTQIFL